MIEYKDVRLVFDGKVVIDSLTFQIARGEKVVVFGKSGCGKSSLLGLLLGFTQPETGVVNFNGVTVNESNIWDVRKNIAYIDQDSSLGRGQVLEGIRNIFQYKVNSHLRVSDSDIYQLLDFLELGREIVEQNISNLSGGERQRIAIAISILLQRDIYLLDEVTSALDAHLKKKVADYFISRNDITLLIVSHDTVWMDNPFVKVFDLEKSKWIR
jgi:putative ABC transport system ATP-binding protein